MRYRTLGRSGLVVSTQCLGTMTFGNETHESDAHQILDRFVDAGGTFLDTADVYQAGVSEEILGRWFSKRSRHDDVVIATKARFPVGEQGPNGHGLSRFHLQRAVDESLRRLQVETIDLYQTHAWDPLTPVEETLGALDDLVSAGKIRYVGVSNVTGWQLQRELLVARHLGYAAPVSLQPQYNLLERGIELELTPLCVDEGVGILPWSPLGGGWLTGKYSRDERPSGETRLGEDPDRGVEAYDKRNTDFTWRVVDAVGEVAEQRGVSMAQVALAWVTDRPAVASTILGVRTADQLDDNLAAADLSLSEEEIGRLDDASRPDVAYPYGLLQGMTAGRRESVEWGVSAG